ncbi:MAG TPA: TatD family hydrolase [Patescibacteria group bacterium]
MYFDTHAHINFKAFKDDSLEVLQKSLDDDIWVVNVGSRYSTSQRAVEFAQKFEEGIYAAVGLHPVHLREIDVVLENGFSFKSRVEEFDYDQYKKLALNEKVVAIGECGLDYAGLDKFGLDIDVVKKFQAKIFRQQIKLATELGLPLIIHCREAEDDLVKVLHDKLKDVQANGAVAHCFMGDEKIAQFYIDNDLYLSFTTLILYNRQWDEIIKRIPLEKILTETDSPYFLPPAMKGKRNEPVNVKYVVQRIARIKNLDEAWVAEVTFNNALKFFKLSKK